MMKPSKGSVKAQFTVYMLPSNLNLGTVFVVEVSRLSGVIAKSLGMSFLPILVSIPAPYLKYINDEINYWDCTIKLLNSFQLLSSFVKNDIDFILYHYLEI